MDNLSIYNAVRVVPQEAKKAIKGGRLSGKTDINPMWRIKTLTEQFGPCGIGWYYVPTKKWIESSNDERAAFVDIELFVKVEGEWSKPISGTGGSSFVAQEKNSLYMSDECFKMATTDAISVACKQLGIGADVYWEADGTKYDKPIDNRITKDQATILYAELKRTGVGKKGLCSNYGVGDIAEMTKDQAKDALEVLKSKLDKPIDPATVPPDDVDDNLPWNPAEEPPKE